MELLDDLTGIVRQIEADLGVKLTDEHFADGREEVVHIFLHEACHAAVSRCAPWIHDLSEGEHTALDEVMARLVEDEVGTRLGLHSHSAEEDVQELALYPVRLSVEQYGHLREEWQQGYWPVRDVAGMARYALEYLRTEGVVSSKS